MVDQSLFFLSRSDRSLRRQLFGVRGVWVYPGSRITLPYFVRSQENEFKSISAGFFNCGSGHHPLVFTGLHLVDKLLFRTQGCNDPKVLGDIWVTFSRFTSKSRSKKEPSPELSVPNSRHSTEAGKNN